MRKRLARSLARRAVVFALTACWLLAPGLPALACTLTAIEYAPVQASMPGCHGEAAAGATREDERPARHACCSDAETSCCLRSLDVEGAVSGFVTFDMPTMALPALVPLVASVTPLPIAFTPVLRPDASPPGCLFEVLRL